MCLLYIRSNWQHWCNVQGENTVRICIPTVVDQGFIDDCTKAISTANADGVSFACVVGGSNEACTAMIEAGTAHLVRLGGMCQLPAHSTLPSAERPAAHLAHGRYCRGLGFPTLAAMQVALQVVLRPINLHALHIVQLRGTLNRYRPRSQQLASSLHGSPATVHKAGNLLVVHIQGCHELKPLLLASSMLFLILQAQCLHSNSVPCNSHPHQKLRCCCSHRPVERLPRPRHDAISD